MTCIHSPTVEAVLLVSVAAIAALHTGILSLLVGSLSTHAAINVVALTTIGVVAAHLAAIAAVAAHLATIATIGTSSHAAVASYSTVVSLVHDTLHSGLVIRHGVEARVGILVRRASVEAVSRIVRWALGLLLVLFLLFGSVWVLVITERAASYRVHLTYLREMNRAPNNRFVAHKVAQVLSLVVHDRAVLVARDVVNAAALGVLEWVWLIVSVHLLHRVELRAGVEAVGSCVAEAANFQSILSAGSEIHQLHAHEYRMVHALCKPDDARLSNAVGASAKRADGILVLFHGCSNVHDVRI